MLCLQAGRSFIWPDAAVPAVTALEQASQDAFSSDFQKYNQKMRQLVFNLKVRGGCMLFICLCTRTYILGGPTESLIDSFLLFHEGLTILFRICTSVKFFTTLYQNLKPYFFRTFYNTHMFLFKVISK